MLNRRQLRIKVMQALYAFFQNPQQDATVAINNLITSNKRTYDLYILLLSVFNELASLELAYIDDAPKRLATRNPLSFRSRISTMAFVKWLQGDFIFNEYVRKNSLSWQKEKDTFDKIYFNIRQDQDYRDYVNEEAPLPKMEKALLKKIFTEYFEKNEVFSHYIEEQNVFWAEGFEMQCAYVHKSLDSFNPSSSKNSILPAYKETEEDIDFIRKLFTETIRNDKEFATLISEKTKNWDVDRIAIMDVILLKMALCEVLYMPNIPIKVSINEYIDISKIYSTPKSNSFINGIIDNLVIELKRQSKITKTGRGLVE
ncbi:MAG: transcription antitermination factor NusB [Bacteroidetes bacterium]|nr:transcription antitermination factor NusB [Bacteroidota bacterium]